MSPEVTTPPRLEALICPSMSGVTLGLVMWALSAIPVMIVVFKSVLGGTYIPLVLWVAAGLGLAVRAVYLSGQPEVTTPRASTSVCRPRGPVCAGMTPGATAEVRALLP